MSSITSVELNYLVFRYLQESGFTHSAFALGYEASINKCPIDGNSVPPGALITFVQKGLQYLEMEANLSNSETDVDEDFSLLQPLDLITKDVYELRRIIKEKRKSLQKEKAKNKEFVKEHEVDCGRVREKSRQEREKEHEKDCERVERDGERAEKDRERVEKDRERAGKDRERAEKDRERAEKDRGRADKDHGRTDKERERADKEGERADKLRERAEKENEQEKQHVQHNDGDMVIDQEDKSIVKQEENGISGGPEPMDIATTSTSHACEIPGSDVAILEGHTSEVFACAWTPTGSLLASGSGDSTARIWTITNATCGSQNAPLDVLVLKHVKGKTHEKSKDVTTLDWNGEGTLLATGSYDGHARIWSNNGDLRSTLSKHKGRIFSLKWNKKGDYLLTGSVDKTAIVWDVKTEECKQQFNFHLGPTLDVDWRNNISFATSSTDALIHVCKIGENRPIKTFSGHRGEVNCVKWDPTASLLASCSDDVTVKIWSMKQDNYVHDLKEHAKEIYTIRWSPTGQGTSNPNQPLVLASASFDSTVKLWDVEQGRLLYSLNGHRDHVYSVAFSPNGEYLASGSLDKCLHVWSLKERKIVKTYTGNGGIFEVCWNRKGDKIAACYADNTVCVLDIKM